MEKAKARAAVMRRKAVSCCKCCQTFVCIRCRAIMRSASNAGEKSSEMNQRNRERPLERPPSSLAAGKLGRRLVFPLRRHDIAFYDLEEAEIEPCLAHECLRERMWAIEQDLFKEAEVIERHCRDEAEKFRQLLDLQQQLEHVRKNQVPWLALSPKERARRSAAKAADQREPVRLFSELSPLLQHLWRKERLELVIDWSKSSKPLMKSFCRLISRLRETHGSKANLARVEERRGNKTSPKQKLLRLVIYRCHRAGLSSTDTLRILKKYHFRRVNFNVPAETTLNKKLVSLAREGERIAFSYKRS